MADSRAPSTLRLILVPTLLTLAVNIARAWLQVQGDVSTATGGSFQWLGITWLVFVFGAWFGWRLTRLGDRPRLRPAFVWALLPMLALVGVIGWQFSGIDRADQSDAAFQVLRSAVLTIVLAGLVAAMFALVLWTRLAWTLLCYAVPARLTVVVLTYLAKSNGWDTHYTKFGPAGIERAMGETMLSASLAQLGFWVPFTIVGGTLAGTLAAALFGPKRR